MKQVWQLVLLWGVVVGVGTGLTAMVLAATVATRWFNHRRGLVMGMLAASNATGQLVFLPLIARLTTDYGWRMTLVFVACMLGVVALFAALVHARPAERSQFAALWREQDHAAAGAGRRASVAADVAAPWC